MSELQELKRLLVGEEADSLKRLRSRVEDRERRIQDISEALPDVIGSGDERLVAALQQPVNDCIRTSIEKDPQRFADILFPVMGPAIRAAISDAMRSLVRSINQTIESTMSVQGLKWRFESMRTGVPYGEIILRNSFVYRVEQVFLVHRGSGLLIEHAIAPDIAARDSDAVSGMLTAIQDFVRDSFADGEGGNLREIEVGSHTVWLAHGPYAMLAGVIRGIAPVSLRSRLVSVLEQLHSEFGPKIEQFDGDSSELFGVQAQLDSCLEIEVRQALDQSEVRRPSLISNLIKVAIGVAILSAIVFWGYQKFDASNKLNAARRIIDGTPGIVVTDVFWNDDDLNVVALADPIADVDESRLTQVGIDPKRVIYKVEPYQSLEAPIVLERARDILGVPEATQAKLVNGVLKIDGKVDYAWYRRMKMETINIVGVRRSDLTDVEIDPDSIAMFFQKSMNAPEGIAVSFDKDTASFAGQAPQAWIENVHRDFEPDDRVKIIDLEAVKPVELISLRSNAHRIETRRIEVTNLDERDLESAIPALKEAALALDALFADCQVLRRDCTVLVLGTVTGPGASETEALWLAEQAVTELRALGVPFSGLRPIVGDNTYLDIDEIKHYIDFQIVDEGR